MKISKALTNFTSGELSPRLLGRSDLKKYHNGCQTLENCLIQTHGGIERRPGTQFVREAKNTHGPSRLVEFQFNVEQSYVLEFGVANTNTTGDTGYIRFYRLDTNGDPAILIETGGSDPTEKTGLPFNFSELQNLTFTQSADVLYVFAGGTRPIYELTRSGVDTTSANWTYVAHEFNDGPYMDMNTTEKTLTPSGMTGNITVDAKNADASNWFAFTADDVGRHIRFYDDSTGYDIIGMDLNDGDWDAETGLWDAPLKIKIDDDHAIRDVTGTNSEISFRVEFLKVTKGLVLFNDTVWVGRKFVADGTDTEFQLYHPDTGEYHNINKTHNNNAMVSAGTTNGKVRLERASHVGWGRITAVSNQDGSTGTYRTASVTVEDDLPSIAATTRFRLGAWSATTGYPKTGTFYQDRLWSASTTSQPQTLFSSGTGNYSCYSPTTIDKQEVKATNAIVATLADSQVNQINRIIGDAAGLLVLTTGGEWLGRAASGATAALTASDITFQKQSNYGSGTVDPVRVGGQVISVQRDGVVIRELGYDYTQDRFNAPMLTLLSEHVTGSGVKDIAYQQGKTNMVWFVRNDGQLLTLTYEKGEEVVAWQRQPMAKSNNVAAIVESVAVTKDTGYDNVWILVKRNINGTVKHYIEMIKKPYEDGDAHNTACYLDSSITASGSASQTWSGFTHLANEAVYILADAATIGPKTVNGSGVVDLGSGNTPTNVVVGLVYTSVMETMPIVASPTTNMGQPKGKLKRAFKYFLNIYKTLGGKVGTPDQVYDIEYPTATSTALNTKMIEFNAPDNSDRETIIRYEQTDAQPATILSIMAELDHGSV